MKTTKDPKQVAALNAEIDEGAKRLPKKRAIPKELIECPYSKESYCSHVSKGLGALRAHIKNYHRKLAIRDAEKGIQKVLT